MPLAKDNIIMIVGAVLAIILQLTLAPYITVGYACANFVVAYAVAVAAVRPSSNRVSILAFIMGLLFNLFMGGPVGAMAVALLVGCFVAGRLVGMMENGTKFMPLAIGALSLLLVEVLYGFLITMATGISFGEAMVLRAVPCFFFDCVLGALFYLIMSRLAAEPDETISLGGPTLLR